VSGLFDLSLFFLYASAFSLYGVVLGDDAFTFCSLFRFSSPLS